MNRKSSDNCYHRRENKGQNTDYDDGREKKALLIEV
jgi:hypothetical protein